MATDLKYEFEIARRFDAIAEMRGVLDDPELHTYYDEIMAQAERVLAAEQAGLVSKQTWLVIPYRGVVGWTYTAVEPDGKMPGCEHAVYGADRSLSRAEAVAEHRKLHVGA